MKYISLMKLRPAQKVWIARAIALLLMVLIAAAVILYAAGVYDLTFVTRPTEPLQTENTADTSDKTEKPAETEEPWSETKLRYDAAGAAVTFDDFLASLTETGGKTATAYVNGKTSFFRVPLSADTAYSRSEREVRVITKTVDMVNSYQTQVTLGKEARPLLEAVSGYLVLDNGDGTFSMLDRSGKTVLEGLSFANTMVTGLTDAKGRAIVQQNGGYLVLDGDKLIEDANATANINLRSSCMGETGIATDITLYSENGLFGYKKADGTKLTEAVYVRAFPFSNEFAVAFDATMMYILDEAGGVMHSEAYTVSSDWETNVKLTMPDTEGIESLGHFYFDHGLLRVRYRINYNLYDGYYDVKLSDREVLMDAVGNVINPPNGYEMLSYHDGIAVLKQTAAGGFGMMDAEGKWVAPPVYEDARACVSGLIPVKYNGGWGLLDRTGAFAVPPVFDAPPVISDGLITAHHATSGWIVLSLTDSK